MICLVWNFIATEQTFVCIKEMQTVKKESNPDVLSLYESCMLLYGCDVNHHGGHGDDELCEDMFDIDFIGDGYRHLPITEYTTGDCDTTSSPDLPSTPNVFPRTPDLFLSAPQFPSSPPRTYPSNRAPEYPSSAIHYPSNPPQYSSNAPVGLFSSSPSEYSLSATKYHSPVHTSVHVASFSESPDVVFVSAGSLTSVGKKASSSSSSFYEETPSPSAVSSPSSEIYQTSFSPSSETFLSSSPESVTGSSPDDLVSEFESVEKSFIQCSFPFSSSSSPSSSSSSRSLPPPAPPSYSFSSSSKGLGSGFGDASVEHHHHPSPSAFSSSAHNSGDPVDGCASFCDETSSDFTPSLETMLAHALEQSSFVFPSFEASPNVEALMEVSHHKVEHVVMDDEEQENHQEVSFLQPSSAAVHLASSAQSICAGSQRENHVTAAISQSPIHVPVAITSSSHSHCTAFGASSALKEFTGSSDAFVTANQCQSFSLAQNGTPAVLAGCHFYHCPSSALPQFSMWASPSAVDQISPSSDIHTDLSQPQFQSSPTSPILSSAASSSPPFSASPTPPGLASSPVDGNPSFSDTPATNNPEVVKKPPSKRAHKTLPPCRICGEPASGFHYGVNSCEACKGFYRRTLKSRRPHRCRGGKGECVIRGGNPRKLCGYCRYQRCLSLGMSPEAIKPGRYTHTKRTQDTLEVLHLKDQSCCQQLSDREVEAIVAQLVASDRHVLSNTCVPDEILALKGRMVFEEQRLRRETLGIEKEVLPETLYLEIYRQTDIDVDNRKQLLDLFATGIEKQVRGYIRFATGIPGFRELPIKDQIKLLKHGREEFWLIGSFKGFDADLRTFIAPNGTSWVEEDYALRVGEEFAKIEFDLAIKLKDLALSHEETVVLKTMCLMASDRCLLEAPGKVEELQLKLMQCLRTLLKKNHLYDHQKLLAKVMNCVTGLRELTECAHVHSYQRPLFKKILDSHPVLKELVTCKCKS